MKKLICLLLALALCLALTACGDSKEPVSEDPVVENQTTENQATEENQETENQPTEEQATEGPADEKELSIGVVEDGVYTNRYLGLGCKLDSNWSLLSAEELGQIPGDVADLIDGSELAEQMKDIQQFTDMMAENAADLTTMNVLYQKLSMQQRLLYAAMSEEQIVDATLEQMDTMTEAYAQAGMTLKSMEKVTVTFMGEERTAMYSVMDVQGVGYYLLQIFDYGLGEYGVTITLASFVEDKTSDLLELFYKID